MQLAFESRADCRIWFWPPCLQVTEPIHLGTQRTDYVSTQAGTDWYEQTNHPRGWEQRGDRHTYKPRSLQTNSLVRLRPRGRGSARGTGTRAAAVTSSR